MMRLIEKILILLASAILLFFGVAMLIIAPEEHRIGYYIFSLLCFSIIGLFYNKGRLFNFFGSVAASIILMAVFVCISNEIKKDSLSIPHAIIWLILFAYPSLKFIIYTKFGLVEEKVKKVITEEKTRFKKENDE